ncbi:MAG: HAMP domain-containing sensor histidine kinase [Clostridia bacterium]|nr:HAMP domain-containing sensor histidine kinase [Clostridia bacterium]
MRTPLTSIKAYIEGLIDGVAATPQLRMKYMKTIKEKADDIDRITDKLFLFSKLDLGDYPFYPETINVKNEICNIADDTKYSESNVNINIKQNDEIVEIYADPVQFRNAVTNILENSLKYKDKDVVNINIGYENTEKYVRIIIDDDGPGVPEAALEKLFNVFYRSDPSRNNPNKGSGLGLAITAKILEHFGGNIYAENIKPKGLRVVMEFPKEGVESGKSSDN